MIDARYPSLKDACNAALNGSLLLTKAWLSVPDGTALPCTIHAIAGGIIQPAQDAKVTLSGSFDGDITQHFDVSKGGVVVLTGTVPEAYPQWWGAKGDGRTLSDAAMSSGSRNVTSASAAFTSADSGKYISVSGCGIGGSALGTKVSSVIDTATAILAAPCGASVSNTTLTLGTNDYPALRAIAAAVSGHAPGRIVFPGNRMYVIGQHKSFNGSCVDPKEDIVWNEISGTVISLSGATIYIDASFYQNSGCDRDATKSNENTITPFYITASRDWIVQGGQILGNKDLIRRAPGVTTECLTCFGIASSNGGIVGNSDFTIRDVTIRESQTDCFQVGNSARGADRNAVLQNDTCIAPARGNFSLENVINAHLSGIRGSDAGSGPYGGFPPFHCVDVEPGPLPGYKFTADNIVMDGDWTCTNNIGFDYTTSSAALVGHSTVRDGTVSWTNSTKQGVWNNSAAYSMTENVLFNDGYPTAAYGINAPNGGPGDGIVSWTFQHNIYNDSTGRMHPVFSAGFDPIPTKNPLDILDNTFNLNCGAIQGRNLRKFAGNYISYTPCGNEQPGANIMVQLAGDESVHDNVYTTSLSETGKFIQTYYDSSTEIRSEVFATPEHFKPGGTGTAGAFRVNAAPLISGNIGGVLLNASCAVGAINAPGAAVNQTATASPVADITDSGKKAFSVLARVSSDNTVTVYVCGTGTLIPSSYLVRVQ